MLECCSQSRWWLLNTTVFSAFWSVICAIWCWSLRQKCGPKVNQGDQSMNSGHNKGTKANNLQVFNRALWPPMTRSGAKDDSLVRPRHSVPWCCRKIRWQMVQLNNVLLSHFVDSRLWGHKHSEEVLCKRPGMDHVTKNTSETDEVLLPADENSNGIDKCV